MSSRRKRNLSDRTNDQLNKRKKDQNSSIDCQLKASNTSWIDDEVFQDISASLSKPTNQNQGRKRLNGTSSYCAKEKENKHPVKQISIDQTLNEILEEQARVDAHSLSIDIN